MNNSCAWELEHAGGFSVPLYYNYIMIDLISYRIRIGCHNSSSRCHNQHSNILLQKSQITPFQSMTSNANVNLIFLSFLYYIILYLTTASLAMFLDVKTAQNRASPTGSFLAPAFSQVSTDLVLTILTAAAYRIRWLQKMAG